MVTFTIYHIPYGNITISPITIYHIPQLCFRIHGGSSTSSIDFQRILLELLRRHRLIEAPGVAQAQRDDAAGLVAVEAQEGHQVTSAVTSQKPRFVEPPLRIEKNMGKL